ncbi:DUF1918 domain-containing protein [Hoyosella sp. YIM 151337]|uniref:DUF1918 domain-containing protein n=1 Tax=Hoyosella sp. YIM 151337 TaxID=2992742 RepID=UPI002235575F|nr:DUF1918 domain-containing protein [Hoyosella sp. YIM 151337]MCW4352214.1 DUF1918 domain-containing protein [Hoyosella sp. YIM 151337]
MHAKIGDWLVVESSQLGHEQRRGLIVDVPAGDGSPPYRVHWLDDDHFALVFPGPDAHVISGDALAEQNARRLRELTGIQAAIASRAHPGQSIGESGHTRVSPK